MPKLTAHGGASHDGHVDVSPDGVDQPDWQPVDDQPEPETQAGPDRPEDEVMVPTPRTRVRKRT